MHLTHTEIPADYKAHIGRKVSFIICGLICLGLLLIFAISVGAVRIPLMELVPTLLGKNMTGKWDIIIWNIRMPQALTAVVGGAGLSAAGAMMQSILRNPLGSPFTLGISHAAAFGAALSVMLLGAGQMGSSGADAVVISSPYLTTFSAFLFSLAATGVIMGIARIRGASPEVMI